MPEWLNCPHGRITLTRLYLSICFFCFFFSDAKLKPAATHALTQPTKDVGGRSSLGPADALGTARLMPVLPDDAPSPSQAN
jgi:hypothetical protein